MHRSFALIARRLIVTVTAVAAIVSPIRAQTSKAAAPAKSAPAAKSAAGCAADLLPDDAFIAVTLRDGNRQLGALHNTSIVKSWLESTAYQTLATNPDFLKAQAGLLLFAGAIGADAWTAAGHVLGKDLTLAFVPSTEGEKPALLVAMKASEPEATSRLLDILLNLSGVKSGGDPIEGKSKLVDGVRGYALNKEACITSFDDFVAFSNRPAALERLIERRKTTDDKLGRAKGYLKAAGDVPKDAVAWAYFDIRRIREKAGENFNKKIDNALAALLFGGVIESVRGADAAALWLEADAGGVTVNGKLYGADVDRKLQKPFVVSAADGKEWNGLNIPGLIGGFELARDWVGFWDMREELIDADGVRGLTEFANTLTTLMGRLDFSSELLPELKPTMRFLAARQEFKDGAPTPELPGFALLLQMKDATKLADRLEQGALMALSIINVDMGQKMQPQFRVGMEEHAGAKMIVAQYPEKLDPGMRGVRYNFAPAIATVGDRFVIATSKKLLTDIIDAAKKLDTPRKEEAAQDVLRLNLRALRDVFDANREVFVTNRMLEQDIPREKAAAQVGMFLDAAKMLSDFSLELRPGKDGYSIRARLGVSAN